MESEAPKDEHGKEGEISRVAGIYRVNSDASIESVDSAYLEAGEQIGTFVTDKGIVIIIGKVP